MSFLDYATAKYIRALQDEKSSKDALYYANNILERMIRLASHGDLDNKSYTTSLKIHRLTVDKCMELLQKNGFVCEMIRIDPDGTKTFSVSWVESE